MGRLARRLVPFDLAPPQLLARDEPFLGDELLERGQPVLVIPAAVVGLAALPGGRDLRGEPRGPLLPAEAAALVEGHGHAERLRLPRRAEDGALGVTRDRGQRVEVRAGADATRLDRGMGPLGGVLHLAMLLNGVDYSRGASHGWMNGAMSEKDVDMVIDAFDRSIVRLREDKRL